MRLVILGASGGCGTELVRQAHERGHQVVAVARESSTIEVPGVRRAIRRAPIITVTGVA